MKKSSLGWGIKITAIVIFTLYAISLIFPFVWMLMNTFKPMKEFMTNTNGLPHTFYTENWRTSFDLDVYGVRLPQMYLNSVIITVGCTLCCLFSSSATAYVLTQYRFPGRSVMYTMAIVVMMIPTIGSVAATYTLYTKLQLLNTYTGIFLTALGGFGSPFLLLYGFYRNLSWTYGEAAQIDGAGHFRIYFSIMLPMAVPALVAVGILQAIGFWNDYFTIYMYAREIVTVSYGIQNLNSTLAGNLPALFTAIMLSIIPILIVFACFQKVIMNNTSIGGIKG